MIFFCFVYFKIIEEAVNEIVNPSNDLIQAGNNWNGFDGIDDYNGCHLK